ncbi:hypothetical protein PPTG_21324 [Phytophthora nicotianae INRA-310]|uniref:Uncharacterized protein n=1 Tax=Phytophthora nicotianae (strain INRA-310) TaxID=761204 RepID=W2R7T6_PHYN3|nr:hypothetical protein PPTG_21324 [Phytophthora nicotianae INRA-310]ETN20590.1 hypothetical protein PPTG_21324 [Phytophthora nicotianae INRA-310]
MTSAPRISTGWRLQQFGEENGQGNDRSKRRSQSASPVRFRAPSKRYNNIVWFKSTALDDTLKQGYGLAWLVRGGKLLYRRLSQSKMKRYLLTLLTVEIHWLF